MPRPLYFCKIHTVKNATLVFLGGGLGSLLRYGVDALLSGKRTPFPMGTLTVNAVGAFLMGLLVSYASLQPSFYRSSSYLLLGTGFCGGFTTFSAFILEALQLLERQRTPYFFIYVIASLLIGLMAGYLSYRAFNSAF